MGIDINRAAIVQDVEQWLEQVVIGLKLCPFATEPWQKQQIRIRVSTAETEEALLTDVQAELMLLDRMHPQELETTIVVVPLMLEAFAHYNEFLYLVNLLLHEFDWVGIYQIASFHPDYCFAETPPEAADNLTNRSPYPLLHILREASISEAIAAFKQPEQIPTRNIHTVQNLSAAEKKERFPYLY